MAVYESFADVYDQLMDNVPYAEWGAFIRDLLRREGITGGLVLDLACGTGRMTNFLAGQGYDMIGVDKSEDMLRIAKDRSPGEILYLMQDMRDLDLYGTVRAVVSVCDSLNYITKDRDLLTVFRLVDNYLDPGGLFIFDLNTEYEYRDLIGDRVIAEDREDVSFIWDNEYDREDHINRIDLSLFVRDHGRTYTKYREVHEQRGYRQEEVEALLKESGLQVLAALDGYSLKAAHDRTPRIVFVARECKKSTFTDPPEQARRACWCRGGSQSQSDDS